MKVHYYGEPDGLLVNWAFKAKSRWPLSRFILIVPVSLIFAVLMPVAWLCVKLGSFGHWLAFGLGYDSRGGWE